MWLDAERTKRGGEKKGQKDKVSSDKQKDFLVEKLGRWRKSLIRIIRPVKAGLG